MTQVVIVAADPGTPHRAKGRPSKPTADLLARSHAALRDELADTLAELRPPAPDAGQLTLGGDVPAKRPPLAERKVLIGIVGDLMRLLGTEIVTTPAPADPTAPARRRGRRPDFG